MNCRRSIVRRTSFENARTKTVGKHRQASQAAGSRFTQVQGEKPLGESHCDANSCSAVGYVFT